MRFVKVNCSDGSIFSGGCSYSTATGNYEFNPGDICKIEPPNIKKLKHRNRRCQLTGEYNAEYGTVKVKFLDSGRFGFIQPMDLVPDQLAESGL